MKRLALLLATFFVVLSSAAFAQTKFPLTIQCNVMDADVYINNKLYTKTTPGLTIQLPPAVYSIKIAKAGYQEYNANVTVKAGGTAINAVLQPLQAAAPAPAPTAPAPFLPSFPLNVSSSVAGAQVFLNGKYSGNTPLGVTVIGGAYDIVVKAPGFNDFSQRININGPVTVNATLTPAAPTMATLSVNSNVNGADVYINGNPSGKTPFSAQVVPGSYTVTVRAAGFNDYTQAVVVNGSTAITASLAPSQATLSINANVPGADVYVNGNHVGKAPMSVQLVPGSYTVTVRAAGYNDYNQAVVVNGSTQVNASLAASTYQVSVDSGMLRGAQVYINGNMAGQTPFTATLMAGSYNLTVRMAGYSDYNVQLNVNGPQNVSAVLAPLSATWTLSVPDTALSKGNGRDAPGGLLEIWIDGNRQPQGSGTVMAGRHTIRVVAGAIQAEISVDFQAGKNYILEPFVGLNIK